MIAAEDGTRLVEGLFSAPERQVDRVWLRRGDRFVERYFSKRWYNIYEIHDQEGEQVKAWYCNISKPAHFSATEIRWVDLALDLLVYPDGSLRLLDQDEFAALSLDQETRRQCWLAVTELLAMINGKEPSLYGRLPDCQR
ncbi:MAG: DUF402 domain-containing protein [Anaerolineaceae bacterium]